MLVFLWQRNIKHLCDFLLWMDQVTEKMVINRFLSPFLNLVSPNTKKNTCDKSCAGGCPFDHPEWASAKSYDPACFLKETNRNLLVWA